MLMIQMVERSWKFPRWIGHGATIVHDDPMQLEIIDNATCHVLWGNLGPFLAFFSPFFMFFVTFFVDLFCDFFLWPFFCDLLFVTFFGTFFGTFFWDLFLGPYFGTFYWDLFWGPFFGLFWGPWESLDFLKYHFALDHPVEPKLYRVRGADLASGSNSVWRWRQQL